MTKRSRSPPRSPEPQRGGPHRVKRCDLHCRRASDARRVAELEAEVDELRGKMAALEAVVGVDLHDSGEVRALRAAQHRNGGGSRFGLLHVQHESRHRVSEAVLRAVLNETERLAKTALEPVSDTVLARWTMPHGVVPSLVAEHVVAPFVESDWVVSGRGAPTTALLNGGELITATADVGLLLLDTNPTSVTYMPDVRDYGLDKLCGMAMSRLDGDEMRRFVHIIEPFTREWPGLAFLHSWCAFQIAEPEYCSADAASGVLATASFATEWDWLYMPRRHPSIRKRNTLVALAAFATVPDHVIALCTILEHGHVCGQRSGAGVWTDFFCRLAPLATTAAIAERLCGAVRFCIAYQDPDFEVEPFVPFFATLAPVIVSDCTLRAAMKALHLLGILRTQRSDEIPPKLPMPHAFYSEFFLPVARRATTPDSVHVLCAIFVLTFAESWAVGDELSPILTKFADIVAASPPIGWTGNRYPLQWLAAVFGVIASNPATVDLTSGMVATIASLVPSAIALPEGCPFASQELRQALTAVMAHRSNSGDTSGGQEVGDLVRRLARDDLRFYGGLRDQFLRLRYDE